MTGIVDQHVNAAMLGHDLLHGRIYRRFVLYVKFDGSQVNGILLCEAGILLYLVGVLLRGAAHGSVSGMPRLGEVARDHLAEAAGCAGNECDEAHDLMSPLRGRRHWHE